jgi:hypothetical protein
VDKEWNQKVIQGTKDGWLEMHDIAMGQGDACHVKGAFPIPNL